MRQLGDLLVWVTVVMVLLAVAYFTPKLAQYMTADNRLASLSRQNLAYSSSIAADPSY
jgi:hypothetical protein